MLPTGIKLTPMLQQWTDAKRKAKDAILLFRMGDFYELFGEDATKAAPLLELTLTSRDKDKGEASMPMAGFPHHAAAAYIAKLVGEGLKVAICDQMEDPKLAKGIVKRDITRVVTPGTVLDEDGLRSNLNNYLVSVTFSKGKYGIAALDVSTGDFVATSTPNETALMDEVGKLSPAEMLISPLNLSEGMFERLEKSANLGRACRLELRDSKKSSRVQLPLEAWFLDQEAARLAVDLILGYVEETQGSVLNHILSAKPYSIDEQLIMDPTSRTHLDVMGAPHEVKRPGTLLSVVDKTCTAMGARKLSRWILAPSTHLETISRRHAHVEILLNEPGIRRSIREILKKVYDLERLVAKVTSTRVNPRELSYVRNSLFQLPALLDVLSKLPLMQSLFSKEHVLDDVHVLLENALAYDPPLALKDGGIFKPGYDATLDELVTLSAGGRDQIAAIEQREKDATGISSLKIKYTRVFGYYIEITKTHLTKVPEHYRRKQTIATGERYVTEELMRLEELVDTAEVRLRNREAELFEALREQVVLQSSRLMETAARVAEIDVYATFAEVADEYRYVRPTLLPREAKQLSIVEGRHPVAEVLASQKSESFVPNSVALDGEKRQILLVTGPNMAGKSTLMRQVALIQLLAQAGSFVPAKSATLSLCDRIFTRVGASDDLRQGRSTFMVEMSETAHILKHATAHSLVLLDEIGRGTSTFDGLSLAWAVAEYLHDEIGARTLFATHYHELTELETLLPRVRNVQVMVREVGDSIAFLYVLGEGAAEQSYGIHVAKLAGLPKKVLERAQNLLMDLEKKNEEGAPKRKPVAISFPKPQLDLFSPQTESEKKATALIERIKDIDLNHTTPFEALMRLNDLKSIIERSH